MADARVTEQAVLGALGSVRDPESGKDLVTLGLVRDLAITGGQVSLTLAFAGQTPQAKVAMHSGASRALRELPGVTRVDVKMGGGPAPAQAHGHAPAAAAPAPRENLIPDVRHTLAVSSGKGGVGKSTVAVNLAVALKQAGAQVGIIDADVYGPDVPMMLGSRGQPGMFDNKIIPVEAHGLRMMSIGLLVKPDEPITWRGPMIHSFIQQMLRDVAWGALDYLVFDMPPGTGDAQISLSQVIPLGGVVMVTTPQDVALLDVRKALGMFQRLHVPILGIVENMSTFVCPHCAKPTPIFGDAGGRRLAGEFGVPLLAQLPLDPETRAAGDEGTPITVRRPRSPQAAAFLDLARVVMSRLDEVGTAALPTIS
ncbi:MAG: Mrp/NBP35 family ATP-binding protein [Candidatus Rokubacteria bacterium]|nr:Mrp/NBP35 family ATP-binding protein [Candidatus Rokubacteria bacterium]MBI3824370.1 Mrp/NBP35 family ATP-binding protein [Candidatus Rokubacteria bacterium]